jgi:hypothetical protein
MMGGSWPAFAIWIYKEAPVTHCQKRSVNCELPFAAQALRSTGRRLENERKEREREREREREKGRGRREGREEEAKRQSPYNERGRGAPSEVQ